MKHLLTLTALAVSLLVQVNGIGQEKGDNTISQMTAVDKKGSAGMSQGLTRPYTATFSSQFEIGDPRNAAIAMNFYKDLENNTVDRHADLLSDTLTFIAPEGFLVK